MFKKKTSKSTFNGLFYKYLTSYLLITVIPVAVVFFVSSYLSFKMIINETKITMKSILTERNNRISYYVENVKLNAEKIAEHPRLVLFMERFANRPFNVKDVEINAQKNEFKEEIKHFAIGHGFYDLLLVDKLGNIIESMKKEKDFAGNVFSGKRLKDTAMALGVKNAMEVRNIHVTNFRYYEPSQKYAMFIITPVIKAGVLLGVAVFQLENSEIHTLAEDLKELGKTGEMLVGIQNGNEILYISGQKRGSGRAFEKSLPKNGKAGTPMQKAIDGITGAGTGMDYTGVKVLAAWTYNKETNWGIVIKKDYSEVIKPVIGLNITLTIISVLIIIIVIFVAFRAAAEAAWPIIVLADAAKKMERGDLGARAIINTNDEIQLVADNLNALAASLQKHEKKMEKINENLTRSNNELEQFAYVASHDLQEPLRAITGYIQLLERKYKDKIDGDASRYIQLSVAAADRMKVLINDLLMISRLETRAKLFEPVDLNEIVNTVTFSIRAGILENKAKISCDKLPVVLGDDTQLLQLFQNLIVNALKYRRDIPPEIHVSAQEQNDEYVISIKDNGIGIEPQYFEKIFVIFQRLHRRQEYSGTGIGLSICKKIVERHGGKIWAESEFGKGSVFKFTLLKGGANVLRESD